MFAEDVPDVPTVDDPPRKLAPRRRASLLIETCLVFRGLGPTVPCLQFLRQPYIWLIQERDGIPLVIALSPTVDVYITKLCLESYRTLLSFAVVTFRIIKSVQPPPFVNCWFSIPLPYQTWTIQFSFGIVVMRRSNTARLADLFMHNKVH